MPESLKNRAVNGVLWSAIGQIVSSSVAFICNIILARILSPDDFGCIGMLAIFLAISSSFINGGFTMALIQKKNLTAIDYTTIFWWNLAMSFFFVLVLYFSAPTIAAFYKQPLLCDVLRILSLDLFICALQIVPISKFKREIRFRPLAIRNIVSAIVGLVAAAWMALAGFGVWTLVYSTLIKSATNTILLWLMVDWRPTLQFSVKAWKNLFNFGGLMLCTSLVDTLYVNINGLIIGRVFSAKDMGYYSQARKLEEVPSIVSTAVINEVSFTAFSKLQESREQMKAGMRYNVSAVAFFCFGLMALLLSIGHPLFHFLYTSKFDASVPYFQILCLASMLYTLNAVNESAIKALGKGKVYFVSHLVKRLIGLVFIFVGLNFGIKGMLWGMVLSTYVSFFISAAINSKLLGYTIWSQIKDISPYFLLAIFLAVGGSFLFSILDVNYIVAMGIQIIAFVSLYILISWLLKLEGLKIFVNVAVDLIKKR